MSFQERFDQALREIGSDISRLDALETTSIRELANVAAYFLKEPIGEDLADHNFSFQVIDETMLEVIPTTMGELISASKYSKLYKGIVNYSEILLPDQIGKYLHFAVLTWNQVISDEKFQQKITESGFISTGTNHLIFFGANFHNHPSNGRMFAGEASTRRQTPQFANIVRIGKKSRGLVMTPRKIWLPGEQLLVMKVF